jgi:NAD(P)-dependent dehydrogenase (short-subunit alcohol dehydrogenase family)
METERASESRRNILTAVLAGAAGLAAGFGGALAAAPKTAPDVKVDGRARFRDKVILITGATSGIGAAAAKMFAAEGGKVAFCGRRTERGAEVEHAIKSAGGEAVYIRADVRIEEEVRSFVDAAADRYGGLDVCFNNAGVTVERPVQDLSTAEWDDVVNTNLRGNFFALKYEIPHLVERGGGVVVVTSSSNAIATAPKRAAYAATKRGLVAFVQAAAQDCAAQNIRINTLLPGTTDTELIRRVAGMMDAPDAVWEAAVGVWAKSNVDVARRVARPEEIAAVALMMAADEYTFMNAAQIVADGGRTAHG